MGEGTLADSSKLLLKNFLDKEVVIEYSHQGKGKLKKKLLTQLNQYLKKAFILNFFLLHFASATSTFRVHPRAHEEKTASLHPIFQVLDNDFYEHCHNMKV